jgi:hypothetical protein
LGLYFYNARWYDPSLGRFIQADTVTPPGVLGMDRYAYVSNNPIRYNDPTGHCPMCILWAAVSFVLTVAPVIAAEAPAIINAVETNAYMYYGATTVAPVDTSNVKLDIIMYVPGALPSSAEMFSGETLIFRGMAPGEGGLPKIGESKKMLGAVTSGPNPDIVPENGMVGSGKKGMSVNLDPNDIPDFRRPPEFGGTANGVQMYCMQICDLDPALQYVPNSSQASPTHGVISPAYTMTTEQYQAALASTRGYWKPVLPATAR